MLSKRLRKIASFIEPSDRVCDVGTDHALLAIYLVQNDIAKQVIATDINEKPLIRAMETIKKCKLEQRITTVVSDGLASVSGDFDYVVIAGMGGELIARIILESRVNVKHFVLSPMTKAPFLRAFLCNMGYEMLREEAIYDEEHYYTIIHTVYTGKIIECSDLYANIGEIDVSLSDGRRYIEMLFMKLSKQYNEKHKNGYLDEALYRLINEIESVLM